MERKFLPEETEVYLGETGIYPRSTYRYYIINKNNKKDKDVMDKIKVLLVEDEETLAMIIKDTLEGQSFIIHTAATAKRGCACSSTCAPMCWWQTS